MRTIIILAFLMLSCQPKVQDTNTLKLSHLHDKKLDILEVNADNMVSIIYSSALTDTLPVCSKGDLMTFVTAGMSVYNFTTRTFIDLKENAETCFLGKFFKDQDWFYYYRQKSETSEPEIVIYNYKVNKIEKIINGFAPNLSVTGDCLYFMRMETDTSISEINGKVFIYRYMPKMGKEELATTLELSGQGGKHGIMEVVGLDCKKYYYRVADEHEYRYYSDWNKKEEAFYSGGHGHYEDRNSKEQYDLCFSPDVKYAAFTERNWNELTYIVLVDLEKNERYQLDIYGSFPVFFNQKLYFISDPAFVNTKNIDFRQIKDYALYYIDLATRELKLVHKFDGAIQFIE